MKLYINKKTFPYKILFYIIAIVESDFWGIIPLPDSLNFIIYQNRSKWIAPLAVAVALICWKNHSNIFILKKYSKFIEKYLIAVTVGVIILYFDAVIRYPLNELITTYGFGTYYFYAYLAIPLLYIYETESYEGILKGLTIIVLVVYVVTILNGLYFNMKGTFLFEGFANADWLRDGKIRISTGAFGGIIPVYSVYKLWNTRSKREKTTYAVLVALTIIYILVVGQSRVFLLSIGCSILTLIYVGDGTKKKKLIFGLLLIIGMAVLLFSKSISMFLNSFSASGIYGGSTIARLAAWKYYLSQFVHNPLTAIGFAGDENYEELVHGASGIYYQTVLVKYYYEDCGFIGLLAKTGIFAFPIYIWPLLRYIKMSIHYLKGKVIVPGAFIISLTMFLLVTTPTMDIFSSSRVIAWPFILSLCEYTWSNYKMR